MFIFVIVLLYLLPRFIKVNHLFAGADSDLDGVLSFQEVLDNHDLFVGSEVNEQNKIIQHRGIMSN